MNRPVLLIVKGLLIVLASVGCGPSVSPSPQADVAAAPLPIVSGTEFESLVQQNGRPLLVEFGVSFGCFRCDQMRPQIDRLAQQFDGQADVVRVDFNADRHLATRYGVTVCPSYVLFDQMRVVSRRSFPTSADLLAIDLESTVAKEGGGL